MATNAELLAQFRSPNFASHVRKPSELKQGLMTEAEARYEQNDGMCPEDVVRECEEDQASLLDLSHFKLRSVPKRLLNLAHIETLDMRHNGIAELPDSLFSLEHVRKVNFSSNRLTEIPFNIVKWSCLTDLDLSGNLLTELPDEFSFLDELVHLNLDFNYFTEIPDSLGELELLSTLYLVENAGIERLPEVGWFRGFRHLDFSLDNSPALCAQWQAIVEAEPQIRASVRWNKIWPDSVLDGIFLGSLRTAQNSEVFSSLNITHVLTCGRNMKTKVPEKIKHMQIEVEDNEVEELFPHFERAIEFILDAVQSKGAVLIHCFAGVSRSSTVCVAYIVKEKQMSVEESIAFVKQHRPAINPNPAFRVQLRRYEEKLRQIRSP